MPGRPHVLRTLHHPDPLTRTELTVRPDCFERLTTALTNSGVVVCMPLTLEQEINSFLTEDGGNLLNRLARPYTP